MKIKVPAFSAKVELVSPPNRSLTPEFRSAHDEIVGLQAMGRHELELAFRLDGRAFDWMTFVTEPTPYKTITDGLTALAFVHSKMKPVAQKKDIS